MKFIKLVLITITLLPSIVFAYSYKTCGGNTQKWNSGRANMYISTTSFPAGSSWDSRLQGAMWHWNNIKGSSFNYYVGRDTDGSHRSGNGKNEVYLDASITGNTLAVTKTRYKCYWFFGWKRGLKETDIAFNSNKSWSSSASGSTAPWSSSRYNFESVALHELGHALGLGHEGRWMATMNDYYPNSGPIGHYKEWDAHADDRQGARHLYPDNSTEIDIMGSSYKRTRKARSGLVRSPYSARRGSYTNFEYTFANLGTSTKKFNISFYLSTNSYISKWDTLLNTNYGAWAGAGYTGTHTKTLYIPSNVKPGRYYLGFIIDSSNSNRENNESNNFMEMPRMITIY